MSTTVTPGETTASSTSPAAGPVDAELAAANLSIDALAARAQLAVALGGGFEPTKDTAR